MRSYRCAKILVETTENISIHDRIIVFFSFLKYKIQGKKRENEKEKKRKKKRPKWNTEGHLHSVAS